MNFLDLVNRLRLECGMSGADLVTVVGQTGENNRAVQWVNASWNDIQTAHQDWQWMRKTATFPTVAGQALYPNGTGPGTTGVTDFGMWARDTFRNYPTAQGLAAEIYMDYIDYENWRNSYMYGALRFQETRPFQVTIAPDKSLGLGPFPNDQYTVLGDYYSAPAPMVLDTDIPPLPVQFHMAIVHRAKMYYGRYESAAEAYGAGNEEFIKFMARMDADRLPEIMRPGPLA